MPPIRQSWPGTMTPRERFNRQMHHQPVDRSVNMEFGYWKENFTAWPMFVENGVTSNEQADGFFGFDPIHHADGHMWMHPGFKQEVIEETEDKRIIRNAEGLLAEVPRDGHATIPHFLKASVVTPDDWAAVKAEHFRMDDPVRQVDVDAIIARHPVDRTWPLGVGSGSLIGKIRDMLTCEGLAYACYDYPEMVEDMVETVCQLVEHSLEQVLGKVDFDFASGWEDIACRSGPLITMDFFRSVLLPRYKRIGARLAAAGIDIWYTDCDGDVRPLIDGFLEAGLNTMFPWEVQSSGHPGEALEKYGPRLRIIGGVDKMVLARGPAAIDEYLQSLLPYVERGGFIPHCDHRCPPDVSPEDYLHYMDRKRELFCRPLG